MMSNKKRYNKKIFIVAVLVMIIISLIGFYRSYVVEKDGVYTIATIYNIDYAARSGYIFDFRYSYKGKEYKSRAGAPFNELSRKEDKGARFFIQILSSDPDRCQLTDYRVPDHIQEAPPQGWVMLPDDWKKENLGY